jgi:ligand-binding sensor domain-containing protein
MALSLIGAGTDPTVVAARYQVKGNMFIGSDEGIWIYS